MCYSECLTGSGRTGATVMSQAALLHYGDQTSLCQLEAHGGGGHTRGRRLQLPEQSLTSHSTTSRFLKKKIIDDKLETVSL